MTASACLYCGGQFLQATFLAHFVHASSHTPGSWCPTLLCLGLGRDGANNLASSRLESWALDDTSVKKTPYSALDSTKGYTICDRTITSCICGNVVKYRLEMMPIL